MRRTPSAWIYTLNMPDELTTHASGIGDLTRSVGLLADGRLEPHVKRPITDMAWSR